jgi:chromosome segregation ATPase
MKREFLTELGLETEQVNKIMAEHGRTVNSLKDEADKAKEDAEEFKSQLSDRDKQLKDLSKKAEGNEDLQEQIKKLQKDNDKVKNDYEQKLAEKTFDFSLEKALANAKAKNPRAVKALLDREAIKLDGDKLLGLEEQLKSLQESDGYLFGDNEPAGLKGRQAHPPGQQDPHGYQGKNPFKKDSFNLTEQAKLYKENPDLYKSLKAQA